MRHRLHVHASLVLWSLFLYYWKVVLGRDFGPTTAQALALVAVMVAIGFLTTILWIRHNLRLAGKFAGRRHAVTETARPRLNQDSIGRPVVHPELAALREATVIDIDADQGRKTYRVVPAEN